MGSENIPKALHSFSGQMNKHGIGQHSRLNEQKRVNKHTKIKHDNWITYQSMTPDAAESLTNSHRSEKASIEKPDHVSEHPPQ